MTTLALNPKTVSPVGIPVPNQQETSTFEVSPADETKNRGRKIKEIKKALKSMKKISRGTEEDKERIAKLEVVLEQYIKDQKQQLSERYSEEFLKSKATIPSVITKLPKAIALSARKVATCIDQIKISKTHKERGYNFFEAMKSIGQTVATPVVYAGKFVVDNWYLSLLIPVLKPDLFENLVNKAKDLINGNEPANIIDSPPIEQTITETIIPTTGTQEVEFPEQIDMEAIIAEGNIIEAGTQVINPIGPTGTQEVEFPEQIDMETIIAGGDAKLADPIGPTGPSNIEFPEKIDIDALIAEGDAKLADPIGPTGPLNIEFPEQIDMETIIAGGDAKLADPIIPPGTTTVEFPEKIDIDALIAEGDEINLDAQGGLGTETINDANVVETNLPPITIDPIEADPIALDPIEADPIQEYATIVDESLNDATNKNLATKLAESPVEVATEEPQVTEEISNDENYYDLPNVDRNYNVFTLGPLCPLLVLPTVTLQQIEPLQPIGGEMIQADNSITETIKRI